ncbi:Hypothetical predicted protein, partial [Paramuricea clavata]
KDVNPELIEILKNSFYVDDFISGADDEKEVLDLTNSAKTVMKRGAFNLRKWNTNSSSVQEKSPETDIHTKTAPKHSSVNVVEDDQSYSESVTCKSIGVTNGSVKTHALASSAPRTIEKDDVSNVNLEAIIDCNRYSSKTKLLRVTALVLKFVKHLKLEEGARTTEPVEINAKELLEAEMLWLKSIQSAAFETEFRLLKSKKEKNQLINQLNLFLDEREITTTPSDSHFEIACTNKTLTKRAKYQNRILKNFTDQWKKEYLVSIREASRSETNRKESIEVGDVVILKDGNQPRTFWRLAKIETLIPSKDKIVRSVMVKVLGNDKKKPILLRRPIQHLVPLEVRSKLD